MKMNSFEKFCDRLVSGERIEQKEIFDERQKLVQMRALCNSMMLFGIGVTANTIIMETMYQWCESYTVPMLTIYIISLIYYIAVCCKNGALIGVNKTATVAFTAFLSILYGIIFALNFAAECLNEEFLFIKDGMVTKRFAIIISLVLFIFYDIFYAVLANKTKKQLEDTENESEEE